ncbi:response regulator [Bosea sp. FBZP-16]|uniref:response regulator n=1 Tax=Bosea sp. FBZP-16 TaxID=2065382 RepID=UPI000C300A0E|nr:response regulator [Bosea sp. FBZP-16]
MSVLILLVEDELLIQRQVKEALVDAGFEVVTAASGAEAFRQFTARSEEIQAVVTDIRLGNGATGWEVARHARAIVPAMPIVYMSGDSSLNWAAQGVPHSIMIAKPFALPQIITAIATLLNEGMKAPPEI